MLYQCIIRGENFPGKMIGEQDLVGFYTRRLVEAANEAEAERLALEMLRDDPAFALDPEDQNDEATLFFEEIRPATDADAGEGETGMIWFSMTE